MSSQSQTAIPQQTAAARTASSTQVSGHSTTPQSSSWTRRALGWLLHACQWTGRKLLTIVNSFNKATIILSLVLAIIFGTITWCGLNISLRLQSWTSLKDYLEYCHNNVSRLLGAQMRDCQRAIQAGLPKPPMSSIKRAVATATNDPKQQLCIPPLDCTLPSLSPPHITRALREQQFPKDQADHTPSGRDRTGVFHQGFSTLPALSLPEICALYFPVFVLFITIVRLTWRRLSQMICPGLNGDIVVFALAVILLAFLLVSTVQHAASGPQAAYMKAQAAYFQYHRDHPNSAHTPQGDEGGYIFGRLVCIFVFMAAIVSAITVVASVWALLRMQIWYRRCVETLATAGSTYRTGLAGTLTVSLFSSKLRMSATALKDMWNWHLQSSSRAKHAVVRGVETVW